ncbi:hypothetical protein PX554_23770 [Sphingomonas sp. H39-1-10]|uniref:conjugal transfer protein TraF n=1 Tax=Sphingomonas pollutisoli TaxID=3030829 RepID=UPI0023B8D505|nr:conjugal transfer protein TraF [Sphingomonas pollutisoli]MDF0491146.1 hypothetical protein [Sphingomonas pollutisoli]
MAAIALACASQLPAQTVTREQAARAAIHPVASVAEMRSLLARVPATRDFPTDFDETLRGQAPLFALEMSTAPGCAPCADLWGKLLSFRARYGWQVRTISTNEAMLRSGRLGLPWVGNPVVWARPNADPNRMVPVAIGTDHTANVARNAYLAAKMLTGVRVAVAVRGMSKFTGLVGAGAPARPSNPRR